MKSNFLVLILMVFSAGYVFANDNITWHPVEDANELLGRWEGSMNVQIPGDLELFMPESSMNVTFVTDFAKTANRNRVLLTFEIVADMDKFLDDLLSLPEVKELGVPKEFFWEMFAAELSAFSVPGLNISVKKYSIGFTLSEEIESLHEDFSQGQVLINSEKTLMKLIFDEELSFGLGEEGIEELIMRKR